MKTQTLFIPFSIFILAALFLYSGCRDWDVEPEFTEDDKWEFNYLFIRTLTESSAKLTWQGYSGNQDIVISGFEINKKVDNGNYEIIATIDGGTNNYTDHNLNTQQHSYTYYVSAIYGTTRFSSDKKIYDFACGYDIYTDPRDGNTYTTVSDGRQCWFAENLKYLPAVYPADQLDYDSARYFVYDYNGYDIAEAKMNNNYKCYGVLYSYSTVGSACPTEDGWHVPSQDNWDYLINIAGGHQNAGGNLKETDTLHWHHPNTGATNSLGFSALPGGTVNRYEGFTEIRQTANFWAGGIFYNTMYHDSSAVSVFSTGSLYTVANSIRCIKKHD